MDSIQGCECEWLIFGSASCHCVCYRPLLSLKFRDSLQASSRMCCGNPLTFTNANYGCEHNIQSKDTDKQKLTPSELQLGVCRDTTKCCGTKYLSSHSEMKYISHCCDMVDCGHSSNQDRNCCVTEGIYDGNDRGRNCSHLFLFLNNLVLEVDMYCAIQHCGSYAYENETKVEVMATVCFCSSAFIFVDNFGTCLYTLYAIIKMLCLVNIVAYHWYLLIVNVMQSDGDRIKAKRGGTANQQNGVSAFLCSWSNSFNPALAKPS